MELFLDHDALESLYWEFLSILHHHNQLMQVFAISNQSKGNVHSSSDKWTNFSKWEMIIPRMLFNLRCFQFLFFYNIDSPHVWEFPACNRPSKSINSVGSQIPPPLIDLLLLSRSTAGDQICRKYVKFIIITDPIWSYMHEIEFTDSK